MICLQASLQMPMDSSRATGLRQWMIGEPFKKIVKMNRPFLKRCKINVPTSLPKSHIHEDGGAYIHPGVQIEFFTGLGFGLKASEVAADSFHHTYPVYIAIFTITSSNIV